MCKCQTWLNHASNSKNWTYSSFTGTYIVCCDKVALMGLFPLIHLSLYLVTYGSIIYIWVGVLVRLLLNITYANNTSHLPCGAAHCGMTWILPFLRSWPSPRTHARRSKNDHEIQLRPDISRVTGVRFNCPTEVYKTFLSNSSSWTFQEYQTSCLLRC